VRQVGMHCGNCRLPQEMTACARAVPDELWLRLLLSIECDSQHNEVLCVPWQGEAMQESRMPRTLRCREALILWPFLGVTANTEHVRTACESNTEHVRTVCESEQSLCSPDSTAGHAFGQAQDALSRCQRRRSADLLRSCVPCNRERMRHPTPTWRGSTRGSPSIGESEDIEEQWCFHLPAGHQQGTTLLGSQE
jgi:hypothetical protein